MPFDLAEHRRRAFETLSGEPLDVLVIGGGIVGAGVARDAAMRGLRTALVEQHDLAFGTSSRSSRLLHGGLRYLAQGRLGLVREASREKKILHRIAPHLAEPLAFVFPTYRGTRWPKWQLRIGVKLYDLLCGKNLGPSSSLSIDQTLAMLPGLEPRRLTGAVRYFDGLTHDARLVLDTLRSAARHGATVLNYARWQSGESEAGLWQSGIRDVLAERAHTVASRWVVNATGPWAESLPPSSVRLRLTKGVHLVIDRDRLPVPDAVVLAEGKRILFVIPWGRRVILGTTDTDYNGPPEAVRVEPDDVAYVLDAVNRAFPSARIEAREVRGSWAGLRPLIRNRRGRPSDISRAHEIRVPRSGWLDVAGGKLTTYRRIAEQVVDRIVAGLGRTGRATTAIEPLVPAEEAAGAIGILPPEVSRSVVARMCREEWAVHLDDLMVRRTSWHYYEDDPAAIAEHVSRWMADELGWDEPRRQEELARCHAL